MSVLEAADPLGGSVEEHTVAPMAGENAEHDCEVCFPRSWRTKKNHIVVVARIPPTGQCGELVFADSWPVPQYSTSSNFDGLGGLEFVLGTGEANALDTAVRGTQKRFAMRLAQSFSSMQATNLGPIIHSNQPSKLARMAQFSKSDYGLLFNKRRHSVTFS